MKEQNDTQLTSVCCSVASLLANLKNDPYIISLMSPLPAPYGLTSLSLGLFSSSIWKTKGVCQTDQLFLCHSPHVMGL